MKLDEKSFITRAGRYMFKRFPMGVKSAQDEFQRAMFETFGDIKNVFSISDDTLIVGFEEDGCDHDKAVKELLERDTTPAWDPFLPMAVCQYRHLYHRR